ncbi:MAG: S-layer homology domain-containing protein [Coriobacteriia bacterium]|nr:S-layer homology domain-containing protein [Coriobacteriia bacterium]
MGATANDTYYVLASSGNTGKLLFKSLDLKNYGLSSTVASGNALTSTHNHEWGAWQVTTPATCCKEGAQVHTCSLCGAQEEQAIPTTEHAWGEWRTVQKATYLHDGTEECTCGACGALVSRTVEFKPFPDVADPENQWFYASVYDAVDMGLFAGYPDGTFGPENGLTRAQAAVVLWRYFDPEEADAYDPATAVNTTGMTDLEDGQFYTGATNWAVEHKVINGYESGTFGPADELTREQLCAVVANAAHAMKGAEIASDGTKLAAMPDADSVDGWAKTSVAWSLDKSVIGGKSIDGVRYVVPLDTVTRAEMAAIMVNAINGGVL